MMVPIIRALIIFATAVWFIANSDSVKSIFILVLHAMLRMARAYADLMVYVATCGRKWPFNTSMLDEIEFCGYTVAVFTLGVALAFISLVFTL